MVFITPLQLSADFFRTEGKEILDQDGNPVILRGLGLGGWLVTEGYILHTPGFGSATSIRNQFISLIGEQKTDDFLSWCKDYDLYVVLDMHCAPGGYNNTVLRALYLQIISQIRTVDNNHIVFIEGNTYAIDFTSLTPPMDTNLVYSFHKY
jgi:hypothetical protein